MARSLSIHERARLDREGGAILIVLHIPHFQSAAASVPYTTVPLGIIMAGERLVTLCRVENEVVDEAAGEGEWPPTPLNQSRFMARLFRAITSAYLVYLQRINEAVDALEDRLQRSLRNRELSELLKYQKSLVYFTTALRSNELVMDRLRRDQ